MEIFPASNLATIRRAHKAVIAKTITAIAEATIEAGEHAVDHVRRYPGFKPRTGKLQDSTEYRTVRTGTGRILRVRNKAPYAKAIDQGSPPHVIRPRRRKVLRFVGRGGVVFARKVNHPGNRPFKFLYKATVSAGRVLEQKLGARMKRIASQF